MVGLTHNERCLIYNLPQMCPPNSPDLNQWIMLFGVLFSNKSSYHNRKFTTVDQLKQAVVEEWNKLSQCFIDRSIDEWRKQQGGRIEHI